MIGRKIIAVRLMNNKELEYESWHDEREVSAVIILDNGDKIYASRDYEGNGPGALFGVGEGKSGFVVYPEEGK